MSQYEFTLRFALGQPDADPEMYLARLHTAGCDDAIVGIGRAGQIALDFSREANTAEEAVISALGDVRKAIPDAAFIEAAPDYVGVPDISRLLGVSRQYVGKVLQKHLRDFPPAVIGGTRSIWHLNDVLVYFADNRVGRFDRSLIELAHTNMLCNRAREARQTEEIPRTYMQATA